MHRNVPFVHKVNWGFFSTIKASRRTNFQIYSGTKLYMFRTVSVPIIRSYPLYIRHWHMLYRSDDSLRCSRFYARSQNCEERPLSSSCLSVRRTVCPHGTNGLPLGGFSSNFIFEYFLKICRENSNNLMFFWPCIMN